MSESALAVQSESTSTLSLSDSSKFEHIQRVASMFSKSQLVPTVFQNNVPNVVIALEMSQRMGASPLMIMQNLNVIHGKPSFGSSFMIATVNACKRFTPLRFKYVGERGSDDWGCYAVAKSKEDGEECKGVLVTIGIAKKEGWYGKNGSKWQSMPELMLSYRAATWWTRMFAPELLMGFPTEDEIVDIDRAQVVDPVTVAGAVQTANTTVEQTPTRRRSKGVNAMKADAVVDAETTTTPATTATQTEVKETAPTTTAQTETAPTTAPVETTTPTTQVEEKKAEPTTTTAPVEEKKAETPAPTPAPEAKIFRCEITDITEKDAKKANGIGKVCVVELVGDVQCVAYFDGEKSKLPAVGAVGDAKIVERVANGRTVKVLESFAVLG